MSKGEILPKALFAKLKLIESGQNFGKPVRRTPADSDRAAQQLCSQRRTLSTPLHALPQLTSTVTEGGRDTLYAIVREAQLRGIKPLAIEDKPKKRAKSATDEEDKPKKRASSATDEAKPKKQKKAMTPTVVPESEMADKWAAAPAIKHQRVKIVLRPLRRLPQHPVAPRLDPQPPRGVATQLLRGG